MTARETTAAVASLMGPTAPPLLELDKLSRLFGGVAALKDVSFMTERSSVHAVIGPNGAGKTTLVNVITGIYAPSSGTVRFEGASLPSNSRQVRRLGVSRTFQNLRLFSSMTVLENCLVSSYGLHGTSIARSVLGGQRARREVSEGRREALEVLGACGLSEVVDKPVKGLPYGTLKRVELARALVGQPRLLLLDEPAAGLNDEETRVFLDDLRRLFARWSMGVLLIEHDMSVIRALATETTVLDFGRVVASGPTAAVLADPAVIRVYLGAEEEG